MATGLPTQREITLLEPFRASLSPLVFETALMPPVSDGSGEDRALLRKAAGLLRAAGWIIEDGVLKNAKGEAFTIEFLDDDSALERHTAPLIKNLKRLGIEASYRVVDPAQYAARVELFDFDMIVRRTALSATPGEGARDLWSSQAAAMPGSGNLAGIAEPVIDALIERIIAAETRVMLTDACRALDRVLRAGFYWIPQWHKASHWLAYWDMFSHPEGKPRYARGAPDIWWSKA